MAIAFDSNTTRYTEVGTTATTSHTCTGSDVALVVFIENSTSSNVTGVTYNGVAMTQVDTENAYTTVQLTSFVLIGAATGANDIVATFENSSTHYIHATSFSGVLTGGDTGGSDSNASTTFTSSGGNKSLSTTTISDNAWICSYIRTNGGSYSEGSNITFRDNVANIAIMGDTNGAITPAGSTTQTWNNSTGTPTGAILSVGLAAELPPDTTRTTTDARTQVSTARSRVNTTTTTNTQDDIKNHSTLTTNLVSYWDLEEASGTRYDLHGSNDLTDNNTVTQATGKSFGNAGQFTAANSEYLSHADNASLSITGDISMSMWYNPDSIVSAGSFITKYTGTGDQRSYFFEHFDDSGTDRFRFRVSDNGTGGSNLDLMQSTVATGMSAGTWYHITMTWDASASTTKFYVDGSQLGADVVGGNGITSIDDGTYQFIMGSSDSGAEIDGKLDEVGLWSKVLTTSEITDLYNSGDGLPYYVPNDVKNDTTLSTSLVSYWEMEQSAGATATDSHGSNDLSDTNSIAKATGILGEGADLDTASSERFSITDASQSGLDPVDTYSISMWVKPETLTSSYLLNKGNNDTAYTYRMELIAGTIGFYRSTSGGDTNLASGSAISAGEWSYLTIVYDTAVGGKIYINGVLSNSDATGGNVDTNTADVLLGCRDKGTPANFFDGIIDEVAFWSKALSEGEIRALYGYGTPPNYTAGTTTTGKLRTKVTRTLIY